MKSQDNKEPKKTRGRKTTLTPLWAKKDGTPVTQTELGNILHKDTREIRQLIRHMPDYARNDLPRAIEWIHTKDILLTDEDGNKMKMVDIKEEKLFHDTRKSKHDANRSKISEEREDLEMEITRGHYILKSDVINRIAEISKEFQSMLFAFPGRVASQLVSAKSATEVKSILKDELKKITKEIDSWQIFK